MAGRHSRDSMHFSFDDAGDKSKKKPDKKPEAGPERPAPPAGDAKANIVSRRSAWKEGRDVSAELDKLPRAGPSKQAQVLDPDSDVARRLAAFREEVNIDPKNLDLLYRYAETLIEAGQAEAAKGIYMRILKLDAAASLARSKLRGICTPQEFSELPLPPPVVIFWQDYTGLLKYPLEGDGPYILLLGTILESVFGLGLIAALIMGGFAIVAVVAFTIFTFLISGYLIAYFFKVIQTTASGEAYPPDWPEYKALECTSNVFRVVFLSMYWSIPIALGYLVFVKLLGDAIPGELEQLIVWLSVVPCSLAAMVWGPMAYLALAIYGNISAISDPRFIFASIARTFKDYVIAWLSLLAFSMLSALITGIFVLAVYVIAYFVSKGNVGAFAILTVIVTVVVGSVTGLYSAMVTSRMLGLFFRQTQNRLGWFQTDD